MLRPLAFFVVLAAILMSTPAQAQAPAASFAGVRRHLSTGDSVVVTTRAGVTHVGTLRQLSDTGLVLRTRSADFTLAAVDVQRIVRREHHIRNGAVIGLIGGFALGAALAVRADDCTYTCFSSPAGVLSWGGLAGGAGMGAGALIGAALPRESVVFEAEPRHARATFWPLLAKRGVGLRVQIAW